MRLKFTILAAALTTCSCSMRDAGPVYAEAGKLNYPGAMWEPAALAASDAGHIYVADISMNNAVHVFTEEGLYAGAFGKPGRAAGEILVPVDVAAVPAGGCYVADFGNKRIAVFDHDGKFVRCIGEGTLGAPMGVAGAGRVIYVADADKGLLTFDPSGKFRGRDLPTVKAPTDVAAGPDGVLAVIDRGTRKVWLRGKNGLVNLTVTNLPKMTPVEVAFDARGNIYVLGFNETPNGAEEYFVRVFGPDGALITSFAVPLTSPTGLAVTRGRDVYVADGSRHEVRIYKPKR